MRFSLAPLTPFRPPHSSLSLHFHLGEVAVLEMLAGCVRRRLDFCRALPASWPSPRAFDMSSTCLRGGCGSYRAAARGRLGCLGEAQWHANGMEMAWKLMQMDANAAIWSHLDPFGAIWVS